MKRWPIFFLLILVFALHFFRLSDIPPGLSNDEAANGYEAYSLYRTGADQWGNRFPLVLHGFGDDRLPMYSYLSIPFVAVFGLNAMAVRLLSVVSGIGLVFAMYFLGAVLVSERAGILAAVLLSVTPWFFGMTRIAMETPLALLFTLFFVLAFYRSSSQPVYYIWSILVALLSMFTYHGSRLFIPLIGILLLVDRIREAGIRHFFAPFRRRKALGILTLAAAVMGAVLLGYSVFVDGGITRLQQVGITNDPTILDRQNMIRSACVSALPSTFCRIIGNEYVGYAVRFFMNFMHLFSLDFLSLNPDQAKGLLPLVGFFPLIVILLAGYGALYIFSTQGYRQLKVLVLGWLLFAPISDSLTGAGQYSRAFVMIPPIILLSAAGFSGISQNYRKLSYAVWGMIAVQTMMFLSLYFTYFPVYQAQFTHDEYRLATDYVKSLSPDTYSNVYISRRFFDSKQYMFYLYYFQIDPRWYQQSGSKDWHMESNGWIKVDRVGNWYFMDGLPGAGEVPDKSLFIGSQAEEILPKVNSHELCTKFKVDLVSQFYFPDGGKAFGVAQSNFQENLPKECL